MQSKMKLQVAVVLRAWCFFDTPSEQNLVSRYVGKRHILFGTSIMQKASNVLI